MKLLGKDVVVFMNGSVLAASTSCSLSLKALTSDASTKDSVGLSGSWDTPDYNGYEWSISNESFAPTSGALVQLLSQVANLDGQVNVSFQVGETRWFGYAIITQIQIKCPANDKVTVSLSLEGCLPLSKQSPAMQVPVARHTLVRGKALMVAMKDDKGVYHTFAAATSHTLTVSLQVSDSVTKDDVLGAPNKERTGASWSLSTENLVATGGEGVTGMTLDGLIPMLLAGKKLDIALSYYPDSIGESTGEDEDWGAGKYEMVHGTVLCTSINVNGGVNDKATYSAEFGGVGSVQVPAIEPLED